MQTSNLVSVVRYFELNGDLVEDPGMWFFTGHGAEAGWVPISLQQFVGGYTRTARVEDGGVHVLDPAKLAELADFADEWAEALEAQGYLEAAGKPAPNN